MVIRNTVKKVNGREILPGWTSDKDANIQSRGRTNRLIRGLVKLMYAVSLDLQLCRPSMFNGCSGVC